MDETKDGGIVARILGRSKNDFGVNITGGAQNVGLCWYFSNFWLGWWVCSWNGPTPSKIPPNEILSFKGIQKYDY